MPPRRRILKMLAKIHSYITLVSVLFYLTLGIVGGPEYLIRDIRDKFQAIAATTSTTNLSLHVIGPPAAPVLAGNVGCDTSSPFVTLDWNETNDTDDYDVYRDSQPLITHVASTGYTDASVQTETAYSYYVIANGPAGNTQSNEISVTTGECHYVAPATCGITALDDKALSRYGTVPEIHNRTPRFSGTTNIANALIRLEIYDNLSIIANIDANINGYWDWLTPQRLGYDDHTIYVTATDPLQLERTCQTSLRFEITEEEEGEEKKKKKEEIATPILPVPPEKPKPPIPPEIAIPFNISVEVKNPDKTIESGEELSLEISIGKKNKDDFLVQTPITYDVFDSDGNLVLTESEERILGKDESFYKKIVLPDHIKAGKYLVRVSARPAKTNTLLITDDSFFVIEKPVIRISTYAVTFWDIINYLGWTVLTFLLILLLFLLLLYIEYRIAKHADHEVSEEELKKDGFIS